MTHGEININKISSMFKRTYLILTKKVKFALAQAMKTQTGGGAEV
jgi:hypothetical protein